MAMKMVRQHDAVQVALKHVDRARVETCRVIAGVFAAEPDRIWTGSEVAAVAEGVAADMEKADWYLPSNRRDAE